MKTINVPTLLVTGDEDILTGVNEAELMRQHINGSQLARDPESRTLFAVGATRRSREACCASSWMASKLTTRH